MYIVRDENLGVRVMSVGCSRESLWESKKMKLYKLGIINSRNLQETHNYNYIA